MKKKILINRIFIVLLLLISLLFNVIWPSYYVNIVTHIVFTIMWGIFAMAMIVYHWNN